MVQWVLGSANRTPVGTQTSSLLGRQGAHLLGVCPPRVWVPRARVAGLRRSRVFGNHYCNAWVAGRDRCEFVCASACIRCVPGGTRPRTSTRADKVLGMTHTRFLCCRSFTYRVVHHHAVGAGVVPAPRARAHARARVAGEGRRLGKTQRSTGLTGPHRGQFYGAQVDRLLKGVQRAATVASCHPRRLFLLVPLPLPLPLGAHVPGPRTTCCRVRAASMSHVRGRTPRPG